MALKAKAERSIISTDAYVGSRIRIRRKKLGLSQEKLAERIGISMQQVQKYESGINRVSASRLQQISDTLGVAVSHFFPDDRSSVEDGAAGEDEGALLAFMSTVEGLQLARAFAKIRNPKVRRKVIELSRSVAEDR